MTIKELMFDISKIWTEFVKTESLICPHSEFIVWMTETYKSIDHFELAEVLNFMRSIYIVMSQNIGVKSPLDEDILVGLSKINLSLHNISSQTINMHIFNLFDICKRLFELCNDRINYVKDKYESITEISVTSVFFMIQICSKYIKVLSILISRIGFKKRFQLYMENCFVVLFHLFEKIKYISFHHHRHQNFIQDYEESFVSLLNNCLFADSKISDYLISIQLENKSFRTTPNFKNSVISQDNFLNTEELVVDDSLSISTSYKMNSNYISLFYDHLYRSFPFLINIKSAQLYDKVPVYCDNANLYQSYSMSKLFQLYIESTRRQILNHNYKYDGHIVNSSESHQSTGNRSKLEVSTSINRIKYYERILKFFFQLIHICSIYCRDKIDLKSNLGDPNQSSSSTTDDERKQDSFWLLSIKISLLNILNQEIEGSLPNHSSIQPFLLKLQNLAKTITSELNQVLHDIQTNVLTTDYSKSESSKSYMFLDLSIFIAQLETLYLLIHIDHRTVLTLHYDNIDFKKSMNSKSGFKRNIDGNLLTKKKSGFDIEESGSINLMYDLIEMLISPSIFHSVDHKCYQNDIKKVEIYEEQRIKFLRQIIQTLSRLQR
jgi:hypothetical protein